MSKFGKKGQDIINDVEKKFKKEGIKQIKKGHRGQKNQSSNNQNNKGNE